MKREINTNDWADFCRRITQERRGALVSIATIFPDGEKRERVDNATLESLEFDTTDACLDVLRLRVKTGREDAFDVIDPRHIILEETQTRGDFNPIQIDGENGTTFLTVHPAIHAETLQGLKVR